MTADVKGPALPMTMTGTYTLSGDSINTKLTDITAETSNAAMQAALHQGLSAGKTAQLANLNKDSVSRLVWISDDEVVMTDSKGNLETFKRIKS